MATSTIYGLVLAGGKSRRMGEDKALLVRDGTSQLEHIAALLQALTDKVFVSTRAEQQDERVRRRFEQIVDQFDDIGPIAGILSATQEYPHVDWLVVACDLPNVDDETIRFLLANRSVEQPFTAYRSSHDDLPEPLCAVYRAGADEIIRKFVDEGLVCPRKILMRSDTCLLSQPNPASLDNVNTPGDLEHSVLEAAS
ncbi:MAG: molybdenum cofactor guanylyltransferase [Proteobacteria bacterium]|nr:molybdenum cofactor guanylyltransferase [Pseudomonadota bacterium]